VKRIYMDANATTPLLPEVLESMRPCMMEGFGNASSIHQQGQQARKTVEHARKQLAALFGCHAAEVVFNSGGTEGDNTAIFGMTHPGEHIITTGIEHSAVLVAAEKQKLRDVDVTIVNPRADGRIDPTDILRAVRPETKLISVMLANNETGVIQPVEEIGRIAAETGIYFHIDAVQGAGKIPIDVKKFGCHILTISGHKMHAPQGIGAMYLRKGTPLEAMMVGGSHERRRRAGTENLPGIVGLGKAAELAMHSLEDGAIERLGLLRDYLERGILDRVPACGVNGSAARVANTTSLWFDYLEGEALVIALDMKGISCSGGSACHAGTTEPSHVLLAMGVEKKRARSSLRFSLMKTVTQAEIDTVLEVLPAAVERLRDLSPVYQKEAEEKTA